MKFFDYIPIFDDLIARSVDPDTGEIINPDFEEELNLLQMAQEERIEQAALAFKNAKADLETLTKIVQGLNKKKANLESLMDFLKVYVTDQLGGKKFKTSLVSIYQSHSAHVEVDDEEVIPEEFIRTERTVMKSWIEKAIKSGEEVPGARMEDKPYTVIR